MPNYAEAKIYKIYSPSNEELIYVGSTTQPLKSRLANHKSMFKTWKKNDGKYPFISCYTILDSCEDYLIELIEDFPCQTVEQLREREGYWVRQIKCLNRKIPGRTFKEYLEENKEKRKEYLEANKEKRKEYREANKEKLAEFRKSYWEANREILLEKKKEYRQNNKEKIAERGKLYRKANKEKIVERRRLHREVNKEKFAERERKYRSQPWRCEVCDKDTNFRNRSRHFKSKEHLSNLQKPISVPPLPEI